ncbi:nucleotidyl transferase AbiEii/AbiGii toxin family protein [Myxococcus fulvus]|uniref:nucleotidyl transferase AbiEii/AbiGii toxin family protein n=1 Tax=Myxococcus fulvus TaxID=33 RepID=UPI0020BE5448|nr:nucleotidyl transferase AbiEii/AbiGii toxin family protein [Myxococcus fulvus]MCK8499031.1 nucleotidyl transferase AbiEii/AbiGii toxin family protein [Myxococcus fulvus]
MTSVRTYVTDAAYKIALETRIKDAARAQSLQPNRYRQWVVFDRFLGRLHRHFGSRLIIKGGVALELRLARARTTKDVDVRLAGATPGLLEQLREAGRYDLGDRLRFEINPRAEGEATIEGDGIIYEGLRFKVEALLAGRTYGTVFPLDVALGDVLTGEVEDREGVDLFSFVGAPRSRVRIYPRETHVAEKLHAYTLPRSSPNSRVKDLVDIALLAEGESFEAKLLHRALSTTFDFRKSHPLPEVLPSPPGQWVKPYRTMAEDHGFHWANIDAVFEVARAFLEPVLRGEQGAWPKGSRSWLSGG